LDWCIKNVPPGKRVVSYLWDDHVIDAFVEEHRPAFELVRRYPEIDKTQGPPIDDADYLMVSLNNEVTYFDAPSSKEINDHFDILPAHTVLRGRGPYKTSVVKIYQRKQPATVPAGSSTNPG